MSVPVLQFMTYSEYTRSPHFRAVRAETLRLAGYQCLLCGSGKHLQAHHTDEGYQHLGEEIPGVHTRALCAACHEALSVGREVLQGAAVDKSRRGSAS